MLHKAMGNRWARLVIGLFATFIYSLGIVYFIVPMKLYSSGMLGVSQMLRTLIGSAVPLPAGMDISGVIYLVLNIPVLLLAWRVLGREFLLRTLLCTAASSLFLSVLPAPAVPLVEERLASCVIGGIVCGFGLGLCLTCGCSTGGLDVLGLCLSKRGRGFTVGRFSIGVNAVIYALCAVLFDVQTAIYSVVYMVFSSLFVDRWHQQNINVQVMIFTHEHSETLPRRIMERLGRGVTYWEGKGAYTGNDMRVLCVCVSKFENSELEEVVRAIDPHAFFIVQERVRIGGNFPHRVG